MPLPDPSDFAFRQMFGPERGEPLAPVRIGMDRRTGKMLVGWPHVRQSIELLFATRYHEMILRQWAGSFVPHLLGENAVQSVITRFYWAIATAIDLWEPCYSIRYVRFLTRDGTIPADDVPVETLTSAEELRQGILSTQIGGLYMPRGHLGDRTPVQRRSMIIRGRGNNEWEVE